MGFDKGGQAQTVGMFRMPRKHKQASLPGICWSLNEDVANRFPFLGRFRAEKPRLLTACVPKHWILAVKLSRGEEEIITFAVEMKSIIAAYDVHSAATAAKEKKMEESHA